MDLRECHFCGVILVRAKSLMLLHWHRVQSRSSSPRTRAIGMHYNTSWTLLAVLKERAICITHTADTAIDGTSHNIAQASQHRTRGYQPVSPSVLRTMSWLLQSPGRQISNSQWTKVTHPGKQVFISKPYF